MVRLIIFLCAACGSFQLLAGTTVNATLAFVDRVELSTPLTGRISQVNVKAGDQVTAGEVLIQLDSAALQAERDAAKAAVSQSKAELDEAQREKQRNQDLYDQTLLSEHEIKLADIAHRRALSAWRLARAKLADSQQRLDYSRIVAPFDGQVTAVPVKAGQTVTNRCQVTPMAVMVRTGVMYADIQLDSKQLAALDAGDKVNVAVGRENYEGVVMMTGLEPVIGQPQIRYPVRIEFKAPEDTTFRDGQPAQVDLP